MEIVKRKQAQLSSDQDYHSVTLRSGGASCRQVHLYSPPAFPHAKCRAERLNPSRFSDPLHRATLLRRSLTLMLPQRTPKAYSWYLDNRFPWKREHSRPLFEDTTFSLFGGHGGGHAHPRRVPSIFLVPSQDDLPSGETATEGVPMRDGWADRNSETSCRSALWGARSDFSHRAPSPDLLSPYSGSLRSRRSLSPAYSHRLSPVFGEKRVSCRSDMSAGALSPRSSHILQLSPAGLSQLSPAGLSQLSSVGLSQLSPVGLSQLSPVGLSQLSPSGLSPRSSRVLQWIRRNYPPSTSSSTSSHSPARCTLSITSKDADTSVGSETDDDFVFVSCRQLVDDLANLSLPSGPDSPPHARLPEAAGRHVGGAPERPALQVQRGEAPDAEDDLSFELCSDDDVLSDDVFEDENARSATCPRGGVRGEEGEPRAEGQAESTAGRDASAEDEDLDCPEGCSALAVEALRRNSLQGKWRRLWRNRRVRAAGKRQKTGTATSPTSARSQEVAESPSPAAAATSSTSAASLSPANESREFGTAPKVVADSAGSPSAEEREEKRGYHYVISPTDDVTMPEVIAVRKSSVELLKWQNSLRRRRRRQAKRHDLCRTKSRAPTSAAAESKEAV